MTAVLRWWPWVVAVGIPAIQVSAALHVVLHKRDVRSAVGWMGLIWLSPVVGALLYGVLGVNRIQRKARSLRNDPVRYAGSLDTQAVSQELCRSSLPSGKGHLAKLVALGDRAIERPVLAGARIQPLIGGDQAYPEMLKAIDGAQRSITLLTYIFDAGNVGDRFVRALSAARSRGVEVRVLIDAVGARYSVPRMAGTLKKEDVPVAHFLPNVFPWRAPYVNLRNHRKIMVVDGAIGFTGGMNIRDEFWHGQDPDHYAEDLHFRVEGPVVVELQEVFAEDWTFTTGERLAGALWFPPLEPVGRSPARGVSDGPDIDFEKLETLLLGALGIAKDSVRIMTPYFLPDPALMSAVNVAALRGVDVRVLLPSKGNLPLVQWAATAQLDQLLEKGVRVFASPPPFDHSKLMVVDDAWTLLGSANWDPRSLQLNFEFNVECYDADLGARMSALFDERVGRSREISLDDSRGRSLPVKVRDGLARLLSPYL